MESKQPTNINTIIQKVFRGAMPGKIFVSKMNKYLSTQGFRPESTQLCQGQCCDELNEPELTQL